MKALAIIKDIDTSSMDQFDISLLSKERQERVALFSSQYSKEQFLAVEQLASDFVASSFDIPVSYFNGGIGEKPYLKDYPHISVSRSYAGDYVVLATERESSIGIDCEVIKDFNKDIITYFFTHEERNYMESSTDRNTAFALLWTRKESFIKCIGRGLDYPLNILDVTPKKEIKNIHSRKPIFSKNDKIENYYINSYIYKGIVISICSEKNDTFPELNQIYEGVIR